MNSARTRHIRSVALPSDLRTIVVLLVGVLGACGKADGNATDAAQTDLPVVEVEPCNLVEHVVEELPGTRCTFPLPLPTNPAHNLRNISVWLDGFKLPWDRSRMEGWDYIDPSDATIQIFGSACDGIVDGTYRTVTVIFDCVGA